MLSDGLEASVGPAVVDRVVRRVVSHASAGHPLGAAHSLDEVVGETLFHERSRLALANDSRADADRDFCTRIARELRHAGSPEQPAIVREIVEHYTDEIRGHFDPRVYAVATRVLPFGLSALLNGLSPMHMLAHLGELPNLEEHVLLEGEVEALRELAKVGTIVLVPTHSSNLDSLLLGHSIYRMGLPPFSYGAGLNLFTNPLTGFFMNHLGAYTVDRKKTDPLYRETLKEFATVLLEQGQHNLFFPGGTRSRSGSVESHLKKGLLGTAIAAFKNNLRAGKDKPRIFVFPATASYPLILEAQSLIVEFLEHAGKWRYVHVPDEFNLVRRWLEFLTGLFKLDLRIRLVIGMPLDPFGDDVDVSGGSHDPRGRPVDPARYLVADGAVADDDARDAEYTRFLASRIVGAYRADNVALPTNITAFSLFELLRRKARGLDLFHLLRSVAPEASIPAPILCEEIDALLDELRELSKGRRIRVSTEAVDAPTVLERALTTFGTYHVTPVIVRRGDDVVVGDPDLLFFYRNRLEGYGLRNAEPLVSDGDDR